MWMRALRRCGIAAGECLFSWRRAYAVGLALSVKYVTQFTALFDLVVSRNLCIVICVARETW